jgi:hypothetical protein
LFRLIEEAAEAERQAAAAAAAAEAAAAALRRMRLRCEQLRRTKRLCEAHEASMKVIKAKLVEDKEVTYTALHLFSSLICST